MSFTDRFLKLPIEMFYTKDAEIVGYNADTKARDSYMKVNPLDISMYRPGEDTENEKENKTLTQTLVYFKNGESLYFNLTVEKFEELINKHLE